jgi:two-component system phosphate regulon sensor histidine kinase PhoR
MGDPPRLLWKLYPSYLIVIVLSLPAVVWYAAYIFENLYSNHLIEDLEGRSVLVKEIVRQQMPGASRSELEDLCKRLGTATDSHITLFDPRGRVPANIASGSPRMADPSSAREIEAAQRGQTTVFTQHSFSEKADILYVATPVMRDGVLAGVLRVGTPVTRITDLLGPLYGQLALGGLAIAILAAGASFVVSQRLSKALDELRTGAERFAGGDLYYRLDAPESAETEALARAMNSMAAQLHQRIFTITRQRNELEAVLSSMVEAVLVVDSDERILSLNRAAEELFAIEPARAEGRSVHEVIRNIHIQRFVGETLESPNPIEAEIIILGESDRFLQVHGTALKDELGARIGALLVLNDITRMKALENIRRDFVANVSHELRTPVTTIQGFLETLKEGAIHDPDNAERFLTIIDRHAQRLSMIIEDLLSLSRLEQDTGRGDIKLELGSIKEILHSVGRACWSKAQEKGITLRCACDADVEALINRTLLEQALVNLVDNAVKYSDPGKGVDVRCHVDAGTIGISVVDEGCGIPREHIGRIFERFYRVDKGRSRREGGTGLGLAIVKHIVNAHRGVIDVKSRPGRGSTFTISLPAPD